MPSVCTIRRSYSSAHRSKEGHKLLLMSCIITNAVPGKLKNRHSSRTRVLEIEEEISKKGNKKRLKTRAQCDEPGSNSQMFAYLTTARLLNTRRCVSYFPCLISRHTTSFINVQKIVCRTFDSFLFSELKFDLGLGVFDLS